MSNRKEYTLPNGKKAVFEYDVCGIGKITLECMDELMAMIADRPQGEWKPKNHHTDYCSNCGFEETQWRTADYNFCPSCGVIMKGVDDEHTV